MLTQGESSKDKYKEVDQIIDTIGIFDSQDKDSGVIFVKRHQDGKVVKIADLVNDDPSKRNKIVSYLRNMNDETDIDLIIALGMAKEGFDWPYCQHALTIGYRGSLTEIIQIIGRATRDSSNKAHAQFTNLIAQPDSKDNDIKIAVNNMLKAITASLLMEQVLAPNFNFKRKKSDEETAEKRIIIKNFKEPSSKRVKNIIDSDINDLKAKILQDDKILKSFLSNSIDAEVVNKTMLPRVIKKQYPFLNDGEIEEVRHHILADSIFKKAEKRKEGNKKFIKLTEGFVNIEELDIELIDKVNPFQEAFEILSKSVDTKLLKVIRDTIEAGRIQMTDEEACILYNKTGSFMEKYGREPDIKSSDAKEKRMGEAIAYLRNKKIKKTEEAC